MKSAGICTKIRATSSKTTLAAFAVCAAVAAFASAWACFAEADATSASLPDLRGFGRVKVEVFNHGNPGGLKGQT